MGQTQGVSRAMSPPRRPSRKMPHRLLLVVCVPARAEASKAFSSSTTDVQSSSPPPPTEGSEGAEGSELSELSEDSEFSDGSGDREGAAGSAFCKSFPSGEDLGEAVQWYDKHHLFSYGGETEHYTSGNEYVSVEWRGVSFHLSICYDLRFPLWLRNRDDYDVLICVASWPSVRTHAWNVLLQARAIENQCYVLGVNRIGKDPYCEYSGGTTVVDPFGMPTSCPEGKAAVLTKTLDLKRLKSFRDKFPVLKEKDCL